MLFDIGVEVDLLRGICMPDTTDTRNAGGSSFSDCMLQGAKDDGKKRSDQRHLGRPRALQN
jgi:hypothetical protein